MPKGPVSDGRSSEPGPVTRVVVVTGAAGAIGTAVCERFAAAGDTVAGLDVAPVRGGRLTGDRLTSVVGGRTPDCSRAETARTEMIACDVADEASVQAAFDSVRRRHGHPAVLINNAGVTGAGGVEDETPQQWRRIIDVNLTGAYLCARQCVAGMRAAGGGRIVNVASVNARFGGSTLSGPAYAASKGGLLTLTRFLAREHAGDNITVNAVAPGPHDTPMWAALDEGLRDRILATVPGPAPGDAADLAAVVEFLCGPHAVYITGATIDVNGGQWTG